jgi:hypothetical protein
MKRHDPAGALVGARWIPLRNSTKPVSLLPWRPDLQGEGGPR